MTQNGKTGTRRVLVTGGGSGIGRAVAERLLAGGGRVAVVGRREAPLRELEAAHPGRAVAIPRDLAQRDALQGLLAEARDRLGGLDGLVHSAGVVEHQAPGHIDEAALRAQLELNLVAPLRLGEQALEVLEDGGGVVFIASTLAHRPIETSAVYSAAKAGLLAAMRSLALAGAARRIRFNAVSPGLVETEMTRELRLPPGAPPPTPEERERLVEEQLTHFASLHPLGRLGRAEEVAEAIVELLAAPWTTGTDRVVDGGLLL